MAAFYFFVCMRGLYFTSNRCIAFLLLGVRIWEGYGTCLRGFYMRDFREFYKMLLLLLPVHPPAAGSAGVL